jgi:hypothetical protein
MDKIELDFSTLRMSSNDFRLFLKDAVSKETQIKRLENLPQIGKRKVNRRVINVYLEKNKIDGYQVNDFEGDFFSGSEYFSIMDLENQRE